MTIGQRIKLRRKELGLTQTDLAHRLGNKSKVSVCTVENDKEDLTTDRIRKYAKALECEPSYLMGWTNEPNQKQLNLYDLTDKDTADHIRNDEFEVRYTLEHKRERAEITKEEYVVLESYRSLSEHEKEMVKRMIAYTDKFNELFKKEG